jgi:hypothetical protein
MTLRVQGIPSEQYERLRRGGPDAYGRPALVQTAEGAANPCRHCLELVSAGEPKLVLAYRPFEGPLQPYAETGPIFLHYKACARYDADALPGWFAFLDPAAIRGYDANNWIRYETGQVVRGSELQASCARILHEASIAYVHIRSKYGCFQARVERA